MIAASHFAVGLTGGIGSGKSLVAELFAQRGAAVIDTDLISHQLTAANGLAIASIQKVFGPDFLTPGGAMDRARMRASVFTDAAARRRLESILHPLILSECQRAARTSIGDYLLFVVPLLVESNQWRSRVERILVIDCDPAQQMQRVMRRNSFSAAQVQAIIATQVSRASRLAAADDVIVNDGEPEALHQPVERLHALYLTLSKRT